MINLVIFVIFNKNDIFKFFTRGRWYLSPVRGAFFIFVKKCHFWHFEQKFKKLNFCPKWNFSRIPFQNFMRRSLVFRSSYLLVIDKITFFAPSEFHIFSAHKARSKIAPSLRFSAENRRTENRPIFGSNCENRTIFIDFRIKSTLTVRRSQVLAAKNRDFSWEKSTLLRPKIDPKIGTRNFRESAPKTPIPASIFGRKLENLNFPQENSMKFFVLTKNFGKFANANFSYKNRRLTSNSLITRKRNFSRV